jgi:hypothetical protein
MRWNERMLPFSWPIFHLVNALRFIATETWNYVMSHSWNLWYIYREREKERGAARRVIRPLRIVCRQLRGPEFKPTIIQLCGHSCCKSVHSYNVLQKAAATHIHRHHIPFVNKLCLLAAYLAYSSVLKLEAVCSSETSTVYQTTRYHIAEDSTRQRTTVITILFTGFVLFCSYMVYNLCGHRTCFQL